MQVTDIVMQVFSPNNLKNGIKGQPYWSGSSASISRSD